MILSADTPVEEALFRMQELGYDCVRMEHDKTIVLSKEDLLAGLLDELEATQAMLHSLQSQVEGGLADSLDLVQESIRTLAQNEKSKLEIAINNLSEGLIILDRKGRIENANPAARRLLTGEQDGSLEAVSGAMERFHLRDEIVQAQATAEGENIIRMENDRILQVRWTPMYDEWSHFLGHVAMVRDITEQRAAETAKSDFITSISHELRTPLTSIQNTVSNIQAGVTGRISSKTRTYLATMKGDCHRLADLINALLDMAKLEAGSMPICPAVTNLTDLIGRIIQEYAPAARQKKIRIDTAVPVWIQPVYVDARRIAQVIRNLMDNAFKFTESGGAVRFRLYERQDQVVLEIEDTGIGIEPHLRERIFHKFYQIHRKSGPGSQGSGLGLSICQGIVAAHGGSIQVQSDKGKGSRFSICLPKTDPHVLLEKHIQGLIRPGCIGDTEIGMMIFRYGPTGTDGPKLIGLDGKAVEKILTESHSLLTGDGDLAVRMSVGETVFVLGGRFSDRAAKLVGRIRKIIGNPYKKKLKEVPILPMVGLGVYPADAGDPLDLERIVRHRMKPLF